MATPQRMTFEIIMGLVRAGILTASSGDLLRQPDFAHEGLEARFGAQGVEVRVNFEVLHLVIVRSVGAFERLKGGFFVAQSEVERG